MGPDNPVIDTQFDRVDRRFPFPFVPADTDGYDPCRRSFLTTATALASTSPVIDPRGWIPSTGSVDAVITLCAEEVCPVLLGKAVRVHWGLPDPAGVTGTEETRLNAFRSVRDELRRRLKVLFGHGEKT